MDEQEYLLTLYRRVASAAQKLINAHSEILGQTCRYCSKEETCGETLDLALQLLSEARISIPGNYKHKPWSHNDYKVLADFFNQFVK